MSKREELRFGFRLLETRVIKEIRSDAMIFRHEKSGAHLIHIANEDDNNTFCINFKTPPEDNSGLPHILEHSVLAGSKKWKVKAPFMEVKKGSMKSFMNAFTFPDKTVYPFSSRNEKDYYNLMDAYLSSVFFPMIYEDRDILKQEGWHYELKSKDDDLKYNGIVYNEMKGARSSPDLYLFNLIPGSLLPETPYGFISGGDPDAIPNLSQNQFESFHRKYYHPANSLIFLYGNNELDQQLEFIDNNYLSQFTNNHALTLIPKQTPFQDTAEYHYEYAVSPNASTERKTFLSFNFAVGETKDPFHYLMLGILRHYLVQTNDAPLKRAILDSGIGSKIQVTLINKLQQSIFGIIVKDSDIEQKEQFIEVIMSTLKRLVDEGINREAIEASINYSEFQLREFDTRSQPKGVSVNSLILDSWNYGGDAFAHLEFEKTLYRIRDAVELNVFEDFIERNFISNPHRSHLILSPSKGLIERKEEKLKQVLFKYKQNLTESEIEEIVQDTRKLHEKQLTPDDPAELDKIPLLNLADINTDIERIPLRESVEDGVKFLSSPVDTYGVCYLNMYFDTSDVPQRLVRYVPLLSDILGKLNTKKYDHGKLSNQINLYTGGIDFTSNLYSLLNNTDDFHPRFIIKSKFLASKAGRAFGLIEEIINHSDLDNTDRIFEVINEKLSQIERSLAFFGTYFAKQRALSYCSQLRRYSEDLYGISAYRFLGKLKRDFDAAKEGIVGNLKELMKCVLRKDNLLVCSTCSENEQVHVEKNFSSLSSMVNSVEMPKQDYRFDLSRRNEGFLTSGGVQYVAKASNLLEMGYRYSGKMLVLMKGLIYNYLIPEIRLKGGAYGAQGGFNDCGDMFVGSYRDPNLKETLKVFDRIPHFIENMQLSEKELRKIIIGTISDLDMPLTPSMKGDHAASNYISCISDDDRQTERDEVLSTTLSDLRSMKKLLADAMLQNVLCVIGNEQKLKQNKEIFGDLTYLTE